MIYFYLLSASFSVRSCPLSLEGGRLNHRRCQNTLMVCTPLAQALFLSRFSLFYKKVVQKLAQILPIIYFCGVKNGRWSA